MRTSWNLSAETRAKMGAGQRGKPLSADHRAKLSAAKIGKPLSAEHRANIGASVKVACARRKAEAAT